MPLFSPGLGRENTHQGGGGSTKRAATLHVFLVDDNPAVTDGLRLLLQCVGIEVCGIAFNCRDALAGIEETAPDAVVLDLALGPEDGMTLIPQIKKKHPLIHILIYSIFDDSYHREQAFAGGASGYVTKQADPEHVATGILAIVQGERYIGLAQFPVTQGGS